MSTACREQDMSHGTLEPGRHGRAASQLALQRPHATRNRKSWRTTTSFPLVISLEGDVDAANRFPLLGPECRTVCHWYKTGVSTTLDLAHSSSGSACWGRLGLVIRSRLEHGILTKNGLAFITCRDEKRNHLSRRAPFIPQH